MPAPISARSAISVVLAFSNPFSEKRARAASLIRRSFSSLARSRREGRRSGSSIAGKVELLPPGVFLVMALILRPAPPERR